MLGLPAVGVEVVKKLLEERKDLFIFRGLDVKCTESAFRHIAPSMYVIKIINNYCCIKKYVALKFHSHTCQNGRKRKQRER